MNILYKFITVLAAVVILLLASTWLVDRLGFGPDLGLWDESEEITSLEFLRQIDGIPAETAGEMLSVPTSMRFNSINWERGESDRQIIPVIYGSAGFAGFTSSRYDGELSFKEGGECYIATVNLLVQEGDNPDGRPIFQSRVFLPYFGSFEQQAMHLIVALVVRADTNGDDKLDCGDAAALEVHDLIEGTHTVVDRKFVPDELVNISISERENTLLFTEIKFDEDSIPITMIYFSLDDFALEEIAAPDLLSKAKQAFENTSSD